MPFDVNQETITPRVSRFTAELNVKILCGKQTSQLEELTVNLNGRIDSSHRQFFISRALTIDLYHAAAILSPRGTKNFVFARPASHWMRGWTGKVFVSILCDKDLYRQLQLFLLS